MQWLGIDSLYCLHTIARIANITQPFPEIQRWQLRAISGEELVTAVYYPRKWTYGQSHISKACWPSIYFLERHSIHCSSASVAKLRHSIQVGKTCCHLSLSLFTSLFLQSTLTCLPPSSHVLSVSLQCSSSSLSPSPVVSRFLQSLALQGWLTGRLAGWFSNMCWGDDDSCSVYGTGRIHCESTLSVNYHRAINRAEKEPLDDAHPFLELTKLSLVFLCLGWMWYLCFGWYEYCYGSLIGYLWAFGIFGVSLTTTASTCIGTSLPLLFFFAHFGTSTFLLLYICFEQSCVVPI